MFSNYMRRNSAFLPIIVICNPYSNNKFSLVKLLDTLYQSSLRCVLKGYDMLIKNEAFKGLYVGNLIKFKIYYMQSYSV